VEEQGGIERVKYGDGLIASLSEKLTIEFGNGFTVRNLRAMRQFYTIMLCNQLGYVHHEEHITFNPQAYFEM